MTISSPVMRYHGSKFRLAEWLISMFPPHQCYVEPFGGAAGVLMQKPRSYAEVYNDLDGEVVNVFRVLRDPELSEQLIAQCLLTPYSRDEFKMAYQPSSNPVEQARRTLYRATAGFGSGGASGHDTGFRKDSKRTYSLASHIWARYPGNIRAFCERLQGVIIENYDATEVMRAHDGQETLHYIDPPYMHDTRKLKKGRAVYQHEMSEDDHINLLYAIQSLEGFVIISGYDHQIYRDMLEGWTVKSRQARISAGRGTGTREEFVWINEPAQSKVSQKAFF